MTTLAEAIDHATERLTRAGVVGPRRDAEWLLAPLLGTDRGGVVVRRPDALADRVARTFEDRIKRRESREPLQYILGEEEFFELAFKVDRRVLIPRPDTETLVRVAVELDLPQGANVADLGTGSGCIAVALAVARPDFEILATDVSEDALALARENASRHGVRRRVEIVRADFAKPPAWQNRFDAIVSNPPYVSEEEWQGLAPEVRDHEPKRALVPGPTGLEAYEAMAPVAKLMLKPGAPIAVELGHESLEGARAIFESAGYTNLKSYPDTRGIARVLTATAP